MSVPSEKVDEINQVSALSQVSQILEENVQPHSSEINENAAPDPDENKDDEQVPAVDAASEAVDEEATAAEVEVLPDDTKQDKEQSGDVVINTLTELAEAIEVDSDFLYGIKVPMKDGMEPVSLSELKDAYYSNRTNNDEERNRLQAEREQFEQDRENHRQQVEQSMSMIQQVPEEILTAEADMRLIAAHYNSIDWEAAAKENPGQVALQKQEYATAFSQAQQRVAELKEKHAGEMKKAQEARIIEQREAIRKAIPEWENEDTRTSEFGNMSKILVDYGFSDREIAGLADHRNMKFIRDFMFMKDKLNKYESAAANVRKVPKVLNAGAHRQPPSDNQKLSSEIDAAAKSKDQNVKIRTIGKILTANAKR